FPPGPVESLAPPRISKAPCCAGSRATEKSSGNASGRSAALVYMQASTPLVRAPPSVTSVFPAVTLFAMWTKMSKPNPCAAGVAIPASCIAATIVLTAFASVPEQYRVTALLTDVKSQVMPPLGRAAMRDAATRLVTLGVKGCFASPHAVIRVARRNTDARRPAVIGSSPGRWGSDGTTMPQSCAGKQDPRQPARGPDLRKV